MKQMTMFELVISLIGEINPSGCHSTDEDREKNLNEWIMLTEDMVCAIEKIARVHYNDHRASMKSIGQRALTSIKDINEIISNVIEESPYDN